MSLQNKNNIINLSSRLLTFVSNLFLNFTRLIIRALVLRSFVCVVFYLAFGIDSAYAWVDYKGVEHAPDSPKITRTRGGGFFNCITGTRHSSEHDSHLTVASTSNNPEEFEAN